MGSERRLYEKVRFDADSQGCLMEPQLVTTSTVYTPTIDMGGVPGAAAVRHQSYDEVVFCIQVGAGGSALDTLDIEALESLTAAAAQGPAGTASAKTFASGVKQITQLVAGDGYATLNKKILLHAWVDELDVDNLFRYIQLKVTVVGSFMLAIEADRTIAAYEPVTTTNIEEIAT